MHLTKYKELGLFLAATILLIIHHKFGYQGHFGADDLWYARIATQFKEGLDTLGEDHFKYRWGLIVPLALSYKFFGINDHSSALPALISVLAMTWIIIRALRPHQFLTQCIGVSLFITNLWILEYSDKIMADTLMALGIFGAFYIKSLPENKTQSPYKQPILFVLFLFFAFLSKESTFLLAPVFALLLVLDLTNKRNQQFWKYTFLIGTTTLGLYFLYFQLAHHHWDARFKAINAQYYFMPDCSYDQLPISVLIRRISYQFYLLLIEHGLALPILFTLPLIFSTRIKNLINPQTPTQYWLTVLISSLLSSNFMTASLHSYSPMCLDPRHYLYLVPIATILAAPQITAILTQKSAVIPTLLSAIFIYLLAYLYQYETTNWIYLPITLFLLPASNRKESNTNATTKKITQPNNNYRQSAIILLPLFFLVLLLEPYHYMRYASSLNYKDQKKLIQHHFLNNSDPTKKIVITNKIQKYFGEYYLGFDTTKTKFITHQESTNYTYPNDTKIYLLNCWLTNFRQNKSWEDLPEYAKHPETSHKLIENRVGAQLFEITDKTTLTTKK
jgi:hypothetical protein